MLKVGILKETAAHEHRVALVPSMVARYNELGVELLIEKDAGTNACFPDSVYQKVQIIPDKKTILQSADIILKVQSPSVEDISLCKKTAVMIGLLAPQRNLKQIEALRKQDITSFSLEFIPRISRAQAMDVLSSQASIAGYKSVLLAATLLGRFFPMMTTAAGTVRPAQVLVIGAGVAGLQAIATARRLGAVVEAYDVRPAVKEQVASLGAKFIDLNFNAQAEGGYARELAADEKKHQQEILSQHVKKANVIICTANVPGGQAPRIISKAMVETMLPGSVILDIAAESGGNCELTQADKIIKHQDVTISGPLNVPSTLATDASEMYARNLFQFIKLFIKDGSLSFDWNDAILAASVITHAGEIKNSHINKLIGSTA